MCEEKEGPDCERIEDQEIVELDDDEAIYVAGGPQEQNIPPR